MENEINENNVTKVEKIDMKAVKLEKDRNKFYEITEKILKDNKFLNDCKKYLEIKNKK